MIQLDIHTHSIASGHGSDSTIREMAKKASEKGLKLLGITDHGPATMNAGTPSYFRGLTLAPKIRFGIELIYGVELNILDNYGTVDLAKEILSHLDYGIASMHLPNKKPGSRDENTESYIQVMKNPYVKVIGHCDDVKYPVDYQAIVQAAKEHRVLLEINNVSLSPDGYRGNTFENNLEILNNCKMYHHPIVLSSDSHGADHIGDMEYALELVKYVDFPDTLILNYDAESFKKYLVI